MIVSASRRTDIPAFYSEWFMNRVREGFCLVRNPFNANQVSRIPLKAGDVDVFVFWTRNPRPLFPHLAELDDRGYRYYFLYTVLNNPRHIDPRSPSLGASLDTFRELAGRVGPERVIWRYDPIVLSSVTGPEFHAKSYASIAHSLRGSTLRSIISFVRLYRKIMPRMNELAGQGIEMIQPEAPGALEFLHDIAGASAENGMEITSCAERLDLVPFGIRPGKCIDDGYVSRVFGLELSAVKDPGQRKECGCVTSRDIGAYDSCLFGCAYCYATSSPLRAETNHAAHDAESPVLIGPP